MALQDQQEILAAIANLVIEIYAVDSVLLRLEKLAAQGTAVEHATAMTGVYIAGAMERIESAAKLVIAASAEGDMLRSQMSILRRLCKYEPCNRVALRQAIAQKLIETGKYVIA
jgi:butyryl-CoA dehydrogenase